MERRPAAVVPALGQDLLRLHASFFGFPVDLVDELALLGVFTRGAGFVVLRRLVYLAQEYGLVAVFSAVVLCPCLWRGCLFLRLWWGGATGAEAPVLVASPAVVSLPPATAQPTATTIAITSSVTKRIFTCVPFSPATFFCGVMVASRETASSLVEEKSAYEDEGAS